MHWSSIPGIYIEALLSSVCYAFILAAQHIHSLQFVQAYKSQSSPSWFWWSTFLPVTLQLCFHSNMYKFKHSTWVLFHWCFLPHTGCIRTMQRFIHDIRKKGIHFKRWCGTYHQFQTIGMPHTSFTTKKTGASLHCPVNAETRNS